MTDKELAKDRFVAHEAINCGKSQCMECKNLNAADFACRKLKPKAANHYLGSEEACPYKEKR